EVGEHAQDAVGPLQHAGRELIESIEPLRPGCLDWPLGQRAHDRHSERRQAEHVVDLALQMIDSRRVRVSAFELGFLEPALVREAVQAPLPAIAGGDYARLGEETLPTPWRTNRLLSFVRLAPLDVV